MPVIQCLWVAQPDVMLACACAVGMCLQLILYDGPSIIKQSQCSCGLRKGLIGEIVCAPFVLVPA
jgi:hypothetical protein